jgi:succinate dehydrogenase (ubiquinone) membrane anchor subunit
LNIVTDSSKSLNKVFHSSGLALVVLTPLAFVFSPSIINAPIIDITLGLLFPLHSHVALNYVITDYVPKSSRPMARAVALAATIIAAAGILKINVQGPGMTETIKSLWDMLSVS